MKSTNFDGHLAICYSLRVGCCYCQRELKSEKGLFMCVKCQYGDKSAQTMDRLTLDRFRPVYESLPMLTFLEGKLLVFHSVQLLVVPMTSSSARLAWQALKLKERLQIVIKNTQGSYNLPILNDSKQARSE